MSAAAAAEAPAIAAAAPRRSMRQNVRANLVGGAVYAAGLWAQMVLFARFGGASAVGAYAYALALTQPVLLLSQLQLRTLMASDARGTYSFREYRALRLATTAAAAGALVPIAWATGHAATVWPILAPVALKAAADSVADVYAGLWQQHERMTLGAWMLAINAAGSVGFMAAAALLGSGAPGMAAGGALGSLVALLFVHLRTAADPTLRPSLTAGAIPARRLARLATEAAPLGLIVLLGSLQANAPRYAIEHAAGTAALGLFAAAFQLTAAGGLVVQAIGAAAAPRLARSCATADVRAFARLSRRLVAIAVALGALGIAASALVGRPVLALVFGPEFAAASGVLLVLSAAAGIGFVATLLGYALTAARILRLQAGVLLAALAVAAVACAGLVPRFGAIGGAWALVLAALLQAGWSAAALRRLLGRGRAAGGALAPAAASGAPSP